MISKNYKDKDVTKLQNLNNQTNDRQAKTRYKLQAHARKSQKPKQFLNHKRSCQVRSFYRLSMKNKAKKYNWKVMQTH